MPSLGRLGNPSAVGCLDGASPTAAMGPTASRPGMPGKWHRDVPEPGSWSLQRQILRATVARAIAASPGSLAGSWLGSRAALNLTLMCGAPASCTGVSLSRGVTAGVCDERTPESQWSVTRQALAVPAEVPPATVLSAKVRAGCPPCRGTIRACARREELCHPHASSCPLSCSPAARGLRRECRDHPAPAGAGHPEHS